jgi:hypothetical protein
MAQGSCEAFASDPGSVPEILSVASIRSRRTVMRPNSLAISFFVCPCPDGQVAAWQMSDFTMHRGVIWF